MNPILIDIENQINKILGSKGREVKIADILLELDLSAVTSNIIHKHPTFSADALCKLYLYRKINGITTYSELLKILGATTQKLGFQELPHKRTFNDFLRKIDKKLLDVIAELILRIATQNNVILDINIVKRQCQKTRKEINRYIPELQNAVKILKRFFLSHIEIPLRHNAKITKNDILEIYTHMALTNDFCNNAVKTFQLTFPNKKVPDGDTIMYHIKKFQSEDEVNELSEKLFKFTFNKAKQENPLIKKTRFNIAIDIHKIPYYGDENDDYVTGGKHERGTDNFHSYITSSIVVGGFRFILKAIPIPNLKNMERFVDKIIKDAKRKIRINKVLLDRGFFGIDTINIIKKNNVKFIMPMKDMPTVGAWYDKSEDCQARVINNFQIGTSEKAFVNLVLVNNKEGVKQAFITNIRIPEQLAHYMFKWYSRRWGIETGYRMLTKDFKARTTSKNFIVRHFYFIFTVALYNLWVLVNICMSITIYGKVLDKPRVTAKIFILALYRVYVDVG